MSAISPFRRELLTGARVWLYSNASPLGVLGIILIVFAVLGLLVVNAPGLYMDAINPDYEVVKVLHPAAPITVWEAPGDVMFGRFPLLFELYAGDLVTYWMVPFSALFGDSILMVRIARVVFGMVLLCVVALLCRELTRSNAIALVATLLLAVDPTFVFGLRTQAYVVLFPLVFVLSAMFVAHRYATRRAYFVAGALLGLAAYGYFVYLFIIPGFTVFLLRDPKLVKRFQATGYLAAGLCVGILPYVLAYSLIFGALGISGGLAWIHSALVGLHVTSDNSMMLHITSIVTTIGLVLSDQWLQLTIWQDGSFDLGQTLKIWIVVGLPFIAFLALHGASASAKRSLAVVLLAVASFVACATYFGPRLGGHDLTSLLTFGYVSAAAGAATLLNVASKYRRAIVIALAVCATFVLVANLTATAGIASKLASNGGGSLYSMAISTIPQAALAGGDTKIPYIFPTWGEMMPFIYETAGTIPAYSGDQLANAVCRYGRANVVLLGDNANFPNSDGAFPPAGLKSVSDRLLHDATSGYPYRILAIRPAKPTADCAQAGDAVAAATTSASDSRAKSGAKPMLKLTSSGSSKGVVFEAAPNPVPLGDGGALPIVSVRWSVPGANKIEIHAVAPDGQLFVAGGNVGTATTGPWVQAGDKFYLQDVSAGSPGKTVSLITVTPYVPSTKAQH